MKISDYTSLFRRNSLTVKEIYNPFDDYLIIKLDIPKNMKWDAGDHGVFTLPGRNVKGKFFRPFSVASIPSEGTMLIATRANEPKSSFKEKLFALETGDQITVYGPFGWFKVKDQTTPIVMIATGIGITPMRAIIKELERDESRPFHLVYTSPDRHLFKEELDEVARLNDSFHPVYATNKEATIESYLALADYYGNNAFYYIAGHPKIIRATKKELRKAGIRRTRFIWDPYFGY